MYGRLETLQDINGYIFKVLYALLVSEIHTQKDIMQRYEMPKQTINNVILSLQKQGFIQVAPSPNDKREKIINLTPSGESYAQEIIAKYVAFEKKVYQKLGAQKLGRLIEIFKDFEVAFSQTLEQEMSKKGQK
ncbi:MarR family winged helix-turn-helix transcriptional regulator [Helicobacter sp. 23-1045]